MNKKYEKLIKLFLTFLKIGAFTFGGGYAMIPLIHREIVEKHKYLKDDEMLDMVAISESTPGPLAVNIATFVGYRTASIIGAVISTFALVLPSFIIITLIAMFFNKFAEYEVVKFAFNGIRICVLVLMSKAIVTLWKPCPKGAIPYTIIALAFITVTFFNINAIIVIICSGAIGVASYLLAKKEDKKK